MAVFEIVADAAGGWSLSGWDRDHAALIAPALSRDNVFWKNPTHAFFGTGPGHSALPQSYVFTLS